jgi:hypothetical protein
MVLVCIVAVAGISTMAWWKHQTAPKSVINNLRATDWAMEQGEAMVVTNVGKLDQDDTSDYMVVKDNRHQRYFAYIPVTGTWVHVLYPGYVLRSPPGREGEFMFPQRDPLGTPVARSLSAGGENATHVFTNGIWTESNRLPSTGQ